ncbi:MAG: hypothetical protein ACLFUB_12910 [Cyclobacteriaceae bacterium]
MKYLKYNLLSVLALLFVISGAKAQQDSGEQAVDPTDIYWGETTKREVIEASELPTEVLKSFEKSEYSDMDMIGVQKITGKPVVKNENDAYSSVPEDSLLDGDTVETYDVLDSAYEDRPYRMREENNDIAETYYQDSYDNSASLSDSLIVDKSFQDERRTYYEIEVAGDVASYKLLYSDEGELHYTRITDS